MNSYKNILMKIITLTVNPALDKSARIEGLVPDQKLKCNTIQYQPGGGGINISRMLNRLNVTSTCLFTSGGDSGNRIYELLLKENVHPRTIAVNEWTRENLAIVDSKTGLQYRFGMPGNELSNMELLEIKKVLIEEVHDGSILVLSGSLAGKMPKNFYAQVIKLFPSKKLKVIVDTSGSALKETLHEKVYLIKPNQRELAQLAGKDFLTTAEQETFAMELVKSKKAKYVVVSLGARGGFIAFEEGILYRSTPSVKVKSTIGAGDSMVAGLIHAIQKDLSPEEMLKWGVACGVATTMSEGTNLASYDSVNTVLKLMP